MTTYSKRRGRRSLAAILAAMLVASVLAVVAGSPAQAANTSGEYLVDHDNDASTAMVREFAGRDRYDTALKLATRFANDRGGIGSVSSAFIASGESLVDAVSVSGLAGFMDAPVLLTRSDALHGGVADYLEDYGIGNLYVLGGTAAVSDGVVDELKGLANSPKVTRISGDTRYDTSAAIASNLSGESWCGTNENSAIVVNGSDDQLFNAVAIGPVANRLELPVLLTAGDELVDAVVSYIESEDVEHVVIVGGTGSVSEAVEQALSDAGVDTVERIGGDSAGEVSVEIAEVIGDDCADDLSPVSGNAVALVNSNNVIDGIPAAPVLADDTDQLGGGLIPILAVGNTLPASVRDYLAGTPAEDSDGIKIHMRVLAIGGTAAVSDSVVDAAVSAAASADALTVSIVGTGDNPDGTPMPLAHGDNVIRLKFSDDIFREFDDSNQLTETATGIRNRLEDLLQVNGVPADVQVHDAGTNVDCSPDSVTVTLERSLKAGDEVSIVASTVKVGADRDQRAVQPASVTVPAAVADTQRPSLRIIAIVGHNEVYALASDNKELDTVGLLAGNLTNTAAEDEPFDALFQVTAGANTVASSAATVATDSKSALVTFTLGGTNPTVKSGDRFRANRGAVEDASDNESQVTTGVPVRPASKLQVSSVQMSQPNHTAQAIALIPSAHQLTAEPDPRPATARVSPSRATNPAVWLQAKTDGAAAGAVGNLWTVRADKATTWSKSAAADIDVFVSTKDRRIVVRIVNGEPKFSDLKAALEANATINGLFNVIVDNKHTAAGNDTCKAADEKLQHGLLPQFGDETADEADDTNGLAGGITKATIKVNFNGYVELVSDDMSGVLLRKVFAATATRLERAGVITGVTGDTDSAREISRHTALLALDTWIQNNEDTPADIEGAAFAKTEPAGPMRSVQFGFQTGTASMIPSARDIVEIMNGFTVAEDGTKSANATELVANGYGDTRADDGSQSADDDWNYASKVRIATSSSVAAPK
ncbi:MAG: cell wall-binding repeat-containing protein [Acidimicrobiaceae bacterium]|nr:cell wall-binding repeat-containing protein [Acidimicrobiaceae bacterium]